MRPAAPLSASSPPGARPAAGLRVCPHRQARLPSPSVGGGPILPLPLDILPLIVSLFATIHPVLTVRLDSHVPLTDQIATGLRCAIAAGEVAPGDPLPTVRQLAADLGLDMSTVARAYRMLEAEGLVASVRGRGTTVRAGRAKARASEPAVRAELERRARVLASEARLAGMTRATTRSMLLAALEQLWQPRPRRDSTSRR